MEIPFAVFRAGAFGNSTALVGHIQQHVLNVAFEARSNEMDSIPIFVRYLIIIHLVRHNCFFSCSAIACAISGGTALPTCLYWLVLLQRNTKSSGKD